MKLSTTRMKILNRFLVTVLAASAVNYSSTDLLLVFRQDGQKNVEFDLGSVTNYLGHAPGTRIPVNYNTNAVRTNFNNSLAGVKFAVVATTSQYDNLPRGWVTVRNLSAVPAQLSFSAFGVLHDKID